MKTVYFKNGTKTKISLEVAKILRQRIIDGCSDFQIFSDENDNPLLFINVSEICLIE